MRWLCFYTCLSVHEEGIPGQAPYQAGTAPGQVHHPGQLTPPQPLGRYTPVPPGAVLAGRKWQPVGGTHPTGMHSCIRMHITRFSSFGGDLPNLPRCRPPPPVNRQTGVKTLPCLKLRLWAANM